MKKINVIPVNEPVISNEGKKNVEEALRSGWISSAGKYIDLFEQQFAKYIGVKYAVTTTSGMSALHLAAVAIGLKTGDEVIVPAFTMAAPWLSVIYTGAKPIFVDCEKDTFNMDVLQVEKKITPRTKAIIAVHIYGHPVDMDSIMRIAKKHKLIVIEDAAEAHGAEYKGKKVGSIGDFGCFSFYANKIITTGEGGMVVTNNETYAEELRKLKDYYFSAKKRFIHEKVGFNYRMTNMQAGLGLGQLKHIDEYINKKKKMASLYSKHLCKIPGLNLPVTKPGCTNVYWMYAVTVDPDKFGINKNELRKLLLKRGIDTRDFFYPPEDHPFLKTYLTKKDTFPNTLWASRNGLYIPSGLAITKSQILSVANSITSIYNSLGNKKKTKK